MIGQDRRKRIRRPTQKKGKEEKGKGITTPGTPKVERGVCLETNRERKSGVKRVRAEGGNGNQMGGKRVVNPLGLFMEPS